MRVFTNSPNMPQVKSREWPYQFSVKGELKQNERGEMIVFSLTILRFCLITCIVPIPDEDTFAVPVYIKLALLPNASITPEGG